MVKSIKLIFLRTKNKLCNFFFLQVLRRTHIGLNKIMFTEENNREINYDRLSKRKLVTNRQINPYLQSNNYLNDISIQDKFLRPKNSNFNVRNKDLNDN